MNDGFSETIGLSKGTTTCNRCGKTFIYNSLKISPSFCSECKGNKDNHMLDKFSEE